MLDIQSIMGCGLTFDKLLWAELRGRLRAKLMRGGLWARVWKIFGAVWMRAKLLRGGVGCGLNSNVRGDCELRFPAALRQCEPGRADIGDARISIIIM